LPENGGMTLLRFVANAITCGANISRSEPSLMRSSSMGSGPIAWGFVTIKSSSKLKKQATR
jgi:hypothetical protein